MKNNSETYSFNFTINKDDHNISDEGWEWLNEELISLFSHNKSVINEMIWDYLEQFEDEWKEVQ